MTLILYENLDTSPQSIRWAKTSTWKSYVDQIAFSSDGSQIVVGSQLYECCWSTTNWIFTVQSSSGDVLGEWNFQSPSTDSYLYTVDIHLVSDKIYALYNHQQNCLSGDYSWYCYPSFKYFRLNSNLNTQTPQWGRASEMNYYPLTMKVLDSAKFLIMAFTLSNKLQFQLVNTEQQFPDVTDSLQVSAQYENTYNCAIFSEANTFVLGLMHSEPVASTIHRIQVDEAAKKFQPFEGWSFDGFANWFISLIFSTRQLIPTRSVCSTTTMSKRASVEYSQTPLHLCSIPNQPMTHGMQNSYLETPT
ncbi:hypothetical protein FGO68_gene17411 [Halteria grandinella]|uniref:Uncharacterized protein n=1 Tax=Halteria grandinella TaxID=5974 RepID=A0A8J8P342_HALGN|nr:hypothetical protein FGO68_gene17411 [Halteria grandinella]